MIESGLDYLIFSIDSSSKETYLKIKGVNKYDDVVRNVRNFLKIKRKKPYTVVQLTQLKENTREVNEFKLFWKGKNVDAIRIKPAISFGGVYKDTTNNPLGPTKACILLWRMLVFSWDGTAVLCCLDLLNNYPVGNINKNSVSEIWNSKSMMKYREMHINNEFDKIPICKECDLPGINLPFLMGGVFLDTFTIKKLIIKMEKISYLRKYV